MAKKHSGLSKAAILAAGVGAAAFAAKKHTDHLAEEGQTLSGEIKEAVAKTAEKTIKMPAPDPSYRNTERGKYEKNSKGIYYTNGNYEAFARPEKPEGVAEIGIDDFMGVELRTAQVIACEPVPKAKKLLKLQIDLGYEQRQVVSGIAKWYKPEDLVGKKIIVVANLKPAKLCGVESQGMILASGEETVRVVFLAEDTPLGERVR